MINNMEMLLFVAGGFFLLGIRSEDAPAEFGTIRVGLVVEDVGDE